MRLKLLKNGILVLGIFKYIKLILKKNRIRIFSQRNNLILDGKSDLKNITLKINGENNKVIFNQIKLRNVNISIQGNNNTLELKSFGFIQNSLLDTNGNDNTIKIGKNILINGIKIWNWENNGNIIIGDNCLFAHDIELRNTDSHPIYDMRTNKRINYSKDVIIKNRVWLASGVRILKGVVIEEGNVIGQQAVISKSIERKNCIVVENGKIVKENIKWERDF